MNFFSHGLGRLSLAGILVLFLTGCGSEPPMKDKAPIQISIVDDRGQVIDFSDPPKRAITLSPSLTEVLYALDLEPCIAGVSQFSRFPVSVKEKPVVGGGLNPSLEAMLALEPDLILHSGTSLPPVLQRMENLGIPVAALSQNTIRDLLEDIQVIARIFGVQENGEALINDLQSQRNRLNSRIAELKLDSKPSVLVLFDPGSLLTAGGPSYVTEVIELAGGLNPVGMLEQPWPMLSAEGLIAYDPDVILFTDNSGGETSNLQQFKSDKRWSGLKAVKEDRLFLIDDQYLNVPGPRLIQGASKIADLIHSD